MKSTFYSNGKLLITAEYLVLDGATALALPTKFGQNLVVEAGNHNQIHWTSFDNDGSIWFEDFISFEEIIQKTRFENKIFKNTLIEILHEAYLLNHDFITNSNGYKITTNLTFSRFWGLGTSSTLINNIAQWLQIDAFVLLKNSFGGSGYDIACAQNNNPILFQLDCGNPIITKVNFEPEFSRKVYFVYLNKKQSSKEAIANYYKKKNDLTVVIPLIDSVTRNILNAKDYKFFAAELQKHENIMSEILEMKTIQEILFPDFKGVVKSLGAWGGDFALVVADKNPSDYFISKGFATIIPFSKMIL